uniref:Transmembrane protein 65 n=1 Tax=Steinernema glaseri TaxID=37863 RepID=A0A1I7XZW0_9BILA
MAAAALGNIISDVAGVGLAHYVEFLVSKAGIKHPVLTSEQLESSQARYTVNMARAVGLTIGCIIGMFPLLFFEDPHKRSSDESEDEEEK